MREVLNIRYDEAPVELTETAKYLLQPEQLETDLEQALADFIAAENRYLSLHNQRHARGWDMRVVNGHAIKELVRDYSWKFIEVSEVLDMGPEFAHQIKGPRVAYIRLPQESELDWFHREGYEVLFWQRQSDRWHDEMMKVRDLYSDGEIEGLACASEWEARKVADLWVASGVLPEKQAKATSY